MKNPERLYERSSGLLLGFTLFVVVMAAMALAGCDNNTPKRCGTVTDKWNDGRFGEYFHCGVHMADGTDGVMDLGVVNWSRIRIGDRVCGRFTSY